jgi:hypothetical protein
VVGRDAAGVGKPLLLLIVACDRRAIERSDEALVRQQRGVDERRPDPKRLRVLGGTSPSALLAQIAANRDTPSPPAAYGN